MWELVEGPTGTGSGGFDDPKQRADLRFLGGARRVVSVGLQCMNESDVGGQGLVDMMHHSTWTQTVIMYGLPFTATLRLRNI